MALSVPNFTTGGNSASVSSITCAAQANSTGNLLVVGVRKPIAGVTQSVTDTAGNSYIHILPANASSTSNSTELWYAKNITGNAANIVTVTFTGNLVNTAVAVWEVAGADPTFPIDTTAFAPAASSTTITSRIFSTTNANEICICMATADSTGRTYTQGAGFTLDSGTFPTSGVSNYAGAQHQIFSAVQNGITAVMTYSSTAVSATMSVANFVSAQHAGRPCPVVNSSLGGNAASSASIATQWPMGTVTGNLLVVGVRVAAADMTGVSSIGDTAGNTFVAIPATLAVQGTNCSQLWYVKNATGNASNTITVNFSPNQTGSALCVWEVAVADLTAPLDTTAVGTGASGTTNTTAAFTTTKAKEVALSLVVQASTLQTVAAGGTYTADSSTFPIITTSPTATNYAGCQHQPFSAIQTGVTASMSWTLSGASQQSLATFTAPTIATPTFSPVAGTYAGTQNVTVLCADSGQPGFSMFYTTDGTTPTTGSTPYVGPVSIASTKTLKVLATSTGLNNSAIASALYTITGGGGGGGTIYVLGSDNRYCTRGLTPQSIF